MPRQEKSPKKKSKKKSPQKSEESEHPAMDQAEMNRLIQNAVEHVQAELQQKHEQLENLRIAPRTYLGHTSGSWI